MTIFGLCVIGATALSLLKTKNISGALCVMCAVAGFTATSAVNVAGNSITPFYLLALFICCYAFYRYLTGFWPFDSFLYSKSPTGWWLLPLFVGWTLLITLIAPSIFKGVLVLDPRGGTDAEVAAPTQLDYNISNANQAAYLLLSFAIFYVIAGSRLRAYLLPGIAFGTATVVSFFRFIGNASRLGWPDWLTDNSSNVRYINFTTEGVARFRGIFPEPSSFTSFSIASVIYFVTLGYALKRRSQKIVSFALAAVSIFNVVQSAAGTSVTGGFLVVLFAIVVRAVSFFKSRGKMSFPGLLASLGILLGALVISGFVYSYIAAVVNGKLGSSSLYVRTTADIFSARLTANTFLLGVGLGSNRPATFWAMLISCTGLIGSILFVWFIVVLVKGAWKNWLYRPTAWAIVAFLLCKTAAGPNLAEPVLWLSLGTCAHLLWGRRSELQEESGGGLTENGTRVALAGAA